jgi:hypothetical protein
VPIPELKQIRASNNSFVLTTMKPHGTLASVIQIVGTGRRTNLAFYDLRREIAHE